MKNKDFEANEEVYELAKKRAFTSTVLRNPEWMELLTEEELKYVLLRLQEQKDKYEKSIRPSV